MRARPKEGGYTILQVCMYISILLSFAAPVWWVLMVMEKNEYEARIQEITKEQNRYKNRTRELDRYERSLDNIVGSVGGEEKLTSERVENIRQKVLGPKDEKDEGQAQHPYLTNKEVPLSQLILSIYWRVRNEAQQLRPLRQQQERVANMLSHQQQRLERYEGAHDRYTNMLSNIKTTLTANRGDLKNTAQEIQSRGEEAVSEIQDTMTEARDEHNQQLSKLDDRIIDLQNEISKLRQQEVNVVVEQNPDGKILRSTTENDWAYIDLGREDRLKPGVIFKVYSRGKRDQKLEKGVIEVKEVFSDYARCKVVSLQSPDQPILKDDFILNPVFDRKEQQIYALAGSFSNRKRIRMLIEKAGGAVRDEVSVDIDFLIVSGNYKEDPKFQKAKTLGVPLMQLQDLTPFLGE